MKKIFLLLAVTTCISIAATSIAFAGTWKQDSNGWQWNDGNQKKVVSMWKWIDSNNDGMAECYYFDSNGYILSDTTIDGYTVNASGAWTEDTIIRQRASNPTAAKDINQAGKELYQLGDQKSSSLPGLDINSQIDMSIDLDGLSLPFSLQTQLMYHDQNTSDTEFMSNNSMEFMGTKKTLTNFYKDGYYYSNSDNEVKYKMKVGFDKISNQLTLGGIAGQLGDYLDHVQIADDGEGGKLLFYSCNTDALTQSLLESYEKNMPIVGDSQFKVEQVSGKALFTPDNYFSKEVITIRMSGTIEGEVMGMFMNIQIDYKNPGQPVTIEFPSTEGYQEVVY